MFWIYLLSLVTVTALPLNQLVKQELLQSFEKVDPTAVKKLQDYVDQLIQEGQDDVAKYTQIRDDAQDVFEQATKIRADAKSELDDATAHHTDTVNIETAAVATEKSTKADRANKLSIKNNKQAILDGAIENDRVEQIRLDKEKALFEKVKGLLNDIKAEGRRLLNAESDIAGIMSLINIGSNADPEQVRQANELLDQLIAQGEDERREVIAAKDKAQSEFDTASQIHAASVDAHVNALGALEIATRERVKAKSQLDFRTNEHNKAVDRFNTAQKDLGTKQGTLDSESARIADEEQDLKKIRELLKTLE